MVEFLSQNAPYLLAWARRTDADGALMDRRRCLAVLPRHGAPAGPGRDAELIRAAEAGDAAAVKRLVAQGASVHARDARAAPRSSPRPTATASRPRGS